MEDISALPEPELRVPGGGAVGGTVALERVAGALVEMVGAALFGGAGRPALREIRLST